MMEVYAFCAPHTGLPTIDPSSLVALSYAQLRHQGAFDLFAVHDALLSHNGEVPFVKTGAQTVASDELLRFFDSDSTSSGPSRADAAALHAFLDDKLLPLVLHTLYSLPHNYRFVRSILAANMPAPARFYKPEQMRLAAKQYIEARTDYWGLGGDSETDDDVERKRRRALLETTSEGWKERRELEQREAKERMKRVFGENKVVSSAQRVLADLEALLKASKTAYMLSEERPGTLDAHLAALLSIVLFLPLPQPLLADTINASFPRLWSHANTMRQTLYSSILKPRPAPKGSLFSSLAVFSPRSLLSTSWLTGRRTTGREKHQSAEERSFARKRNMFALVVTVGMIGWGLGVGAIPLPGRPGIWATLRADEEVEYEEVDAEEEEIEEDE